jgi:hypothetical protein
MGDRCYCQLTLWGIADRTAANAIYEAIYNYDGTPLDDIRKSLEEENETIDFEEVNCAMLNNDIRNAIVAAGLGYSWSNDSGNNYGAGFEVYDLLSDEVYAFSTIDGEIMIALSQIRNPDLIERAEKADKIQQAGRKLGLHVADSAHERIELLAANSDLAAFEAKKTNIDR